VGLLALLHAASNAEIRGLRVVDIDTTRRTVALAGRPFPTPLDPPTWTALHRCLTGRETAHTLNPHVIVTRTTSGRDTAADSSYLTRLLAPAGNGSGARREQIEPRDGAWVAEATGVVDMSSWPVGTRLILRKERPHPGAQLRITDADGLRVIGFLTNTRPGGPARQLADLELRHRRHARVEDRIRAAKDTGMRNLPFHDMNQNRIWLAITALASELLAWCAQLALPAGSALYEPKRLRLRILAVAGRLVRTARRTTLKIDPNWPWATAITLAHTRLRALPVP
jgi:hypothetical protein